MDQNVIVNGYTILWDQQVGAGNFATVVKCIHNQSKIIYAAKVIQKVKVEMDDSLKQSFDDEVMNIQTKSQNLVSFRELLQCKKYYYIVQELCDQNLRDYMKKNRFMSEKEAIRILQEMVSGVFDLFVAHITHRDLKPQNIFLKDLKVKIGDFGVSKKNPHNKCSFEEPAGSLIYMSIEALKGQKYTSKCDIWSIGLIFYQLVHGQCPWYREGDNKNTLINKILHQSLKINNSLLEITRHFLKKCLIIHQEKRLNWINFFDHPIFQGKYKQFITQYKRCKKRITKIYQNITLSLANTQTTLYQVASQMFIHKNQLDFTDFYRLLLKVDKTVQQQEALLIFQETDLNKDGFIDLYLIQNQLNLQNKVSECNGKELKGSNTDYIKKQKIELLASRQGIKVGFKKANAIMKIKNEQLKVIYEKYQTKYHKMQRQIFVSFLKKYWSQLNDDQVRQIFDLLSNNGEVDYYDFHAFNQIAIGPDEQLPIHVLRHKQSCPVTYQPTPQTQYTPNEEYHLSKFTKCQTMNEIYEDQNFRNSQNSHAGSSNSRFIRKNSKYKSKVINREIGDFWEV